MPDRDTAITRSSGPTQRGNVGPDASISGSEMSSATSARKTSHAAALEPTADSTTARGRSSASDSTSASPTRVEASLTWAPDPAIVRSMPGKIGCGERVRIVEQPLVELDGHQPATGRIRASSISRTGMSSRTG